MYGLPPNLKSSSHKTWQTSLLLLKPLQIQNLKRTKWGDMAYYVPPSEKVGGHVPRVGRSENPLSHHLWVAMLSFFIFSKRFKPKFGSNRGFLSGLEQWQISSDVPGSFLSSQSHKPFESESSKIFRFGSESKSWLGRVESETSHKNCRVTSSHWFLSSSQRRVTWNFTFFLLHFLCYEMVPNML